MAEAKQLQVGDVIYRTVRGKVDSKITIVRVNENTAFFDEFANGFQRKLGPNGKVYFSNGSKWDRIKVFYIETPDLIEKWEHKELSEKLANANVPCLTIDQAAPYHCHYRGKARRGPFRPCNRHPYT